MTLLTLSFAKAQSSNLDLKGLDNKTYHLVGPGVDLSGNCGNNVEFTLSAAGTCTLTFNEAEGVSCHLKFEVDGDGMISNPIWKDADSSLTGGGWDSLGLDLYSIDPDGKTLVLTGSSLLIDFSALDILAMHVPQLTGGSQPSGTHQLMPGDYTFTGPNYAGTLYFEVDQAGDVPANLHWNYAALNGTSHETLADSFYTCHNSANKLILHGEEFTYDLTQMPAGEMDFTGMVQGSGIAFAGGSLTLGLLPGRYVSTYYVVQNQTLVSKGIFRMDVLNSTAAFDGQLYWQEPNTNPFVLYDFVNYYREPLVVHLLEVPDVNSSMRAEANSGVLQRTLDGGTHETDDLLRFRFDEEYEPQDLVWSVFDHHRTVMPASGSFSSTAFGYNRFELDLTALDPGVYLLEVTNAKSEKFYLRFKRN